MNKPMTTADLFEQICYILLINGFFSGIAKYTVEESTPMPLTTTKYGIKSHLDYDTCEGINLDLWILIHTDSGVKEQKLGTIYTLEDDLHARQVMGNLLAYFLIEERNYVNSHLDDFIWEGIKVRVFDHDENELSWSFSYDNMEKALKKKDELLKAYPHVVIRDNATRKEKSYRKR